MAFFQIGKERVDPPISTAKITGGGGESESKNSTPSSSLPRAIGSSPTPTESTSQKVQVINGKPYRIISGNS